MNIREVKRVDVHFLLIIGLIARSFIDKNNFMIDKEKKSTVTSSAKINEPLLYEMIDWELTLQNSLYIKQTVCQNLHQIFFFPS